MAGESDPPTDRRTGPSEPVPVRIEGPVPIPVVLADSGAVKATAAPVQSQQLDPSLPAKTTFQEDLTKAGQRHINVMWEGTQRNIAQEVTITALATTAFLVMWPDIPTELRLVAYATLSNVFFAVTSVYFTRTNHTTTGGVGSGKYEGR